MANTRRTKMGHGMWQVTGVGELRHTILGTVEKVYGGWYAVAQDSTERSGETLAESQEWLLEQYQRFARRVVTLQPSSHVDGITEDGEEMTKRPYPFHVNVKGEIVGGAEKGGRVIGFVGDPARYEIDLDWDEIYLAPQRAVGLYVVTSDTDGVWSTHTLAIESVRDV